MSPLEDPPKRRPGRLFLILAVAAALAGVGLMASMRYFGSFMTYEKSGECKRGLRTLAVLAGQYLMEHDTLPTRVSDFPIDSFPRQNRFALVLSLSGPVERRNAKDSPTLAEATAFGPDEWYFKSDSRVRAISLGEVPMVFGDVRPGVTGDCAKGACALVAVCIGNVDRDEDLDVWSISTAPRTGRDGTVVPANTVHHDVDDGDYWHFTPEF